MLAISMVVRLIAALVLSFLRLAITPVKLTVPPPNVEILGAMPTQQAVVGALTDLANNAAPAFGNMGQVPYSGVTNVWLAGDMVAGVIRRYGAGSANDMTDTAQNIVNMIPGAKVGQTFPLFVANMASGTLTPRAGTGVTLVGTSTITGNACRLFMGMVTGSAAVSLTSCWQFGTSSISQFGITP